MSGLLHIKRFRQNMFKLFVIYLVVILSTTSVITYSRYITSMESSATARPAKFVINIEQGDICVADTELCNLDKYKPYDQLDYYFTVDTRELEVSTILATVIDVDTHYNIVGIYEDSVENQIDIASNSDYTQAGRKITIARDVLAGAGDIKTYIIRLSYIESSVATPKFDAVSVNFAATQKD